MSRLLGTNDIREPFPFQGQRSRGQTVSPGAGRRGSPAPTLLSPARGLHGRNPEISEQGSPGGTVQRVQALGAQRKRSGGKDQGGETGCSGDEPERMGCERLCKECISQVKKLCSLHGPRASPKNPQNVDLERGSIWRIAK